MSFSTGYLNQQANISNEHMWDHSQGQQGTTQRHTHAYAYAYNGYALGVEPRPAENLDGVGDRLVTVVRREALSHRREHGVADPLVVHVRRLVCQQPRRLRAHSHVRDHELHRLVLGNRLAHRLALDGVRLRGRGG